MGISVEVHITFILFFLLLIFAGFANFIFFFIIFSIVLAHELCHSIAALSSGIPVPRIILLPFGGSAIMELSENPLTELKIALSGPFFNFFFAGVGFLLIKAMNLNLFSYDQLMDMLIGGDTSIFTPAYVLSMLVMSNLVLGLFNMLPAFPMDGGRVFRSVLALWIDYVKATRIAGRIGQIISVFLIVYGFLANFWFFLIGLYLIAIGGNEVKFVLLKKAFEGLYMRDLISSQRKIPVVEGSISLKDFFDVVAKPDQRFYLVVSPDGNLKGMLDLHQLNETVIDTKVKEINSLARGGYGIVEGSARVDAAITKVFSNDITLVVEDSMILGYMTPELFMELTNFYNFGKKSPPTA